MDSPEKYKVKVYCRDTVRRGVIRKAGSRAGKFKDHEEGKMSVCTNKNIALYEILPWDRIRYWYQTDNIFEGSTSCVQTVGHSYWEVNYCKGELETVSVLVQSGSGLQLHAFLVRAGISFSPDLPLHINKI